MNVNKVLLTGASGFIGRYLCRILNDNNIKIYAIFRSEKSYEKNASSLKNVIPVICDLDEIKILPDLINCDSIDTVYHLAWDGVSGVDRGDHDLQLNNIANTLNLVSVAKTIGCRRFIGVGSTAEYDAYNASIEDGICPNLVSMYGISKLTAQLMTKVMCNAYGLEHVWGIVGNTFGVGDYSNNFINFASKLIMSDDDANFTSGEQNYDFIYVTDVAKALYCIGNSGKDKCSYYIGSGEPRKLKEYIVEIRDIINPNKKLKMGAVPFNGKSSPIEVFDINNITKDTGFLPKISFGVGVKKTVEWLKGENADV